MLTPGSDTDYGQIQYDWRELSERYIKISYFFATLGVLKLLQNQSALLYLAFHVALCW